MFSADLAGVPPSSPHSHGRTLRRCRVKGNELKTAIEVKSTGFIPRPNPVSFDAPLRGEADIAMHRRLYCGHYSNCLNQSVHEGWAGFSCTHCPLRDYASNGPRSEPFAHRNPNAE